MIITYIIPGAGMGNQMFMYSAGLAAAERLKTELRLGTWNFETQTGNNRKYYLSCFPEITEREASVGDLWKVSKWQIIINLMRRRPIKKYDIFRKVICSFINRHFLTSYVENENTKISDFKNIHDNTFIKGYWESEEIFSDIASIVRKKFKFPDSYFDNDFSNKIKSCNNSVALHVRRGDKVNHKYLLASDENYIRNAINKISAMIDNPEFFVFSDDIEYCKKTLPKIHKAQYNFAENNTPPKDMALMTICRHAIIAPSTFSWWAAWLNDNPKKIVIAPDLNLWSAKSLFSYERFPAEWIKIA